MPTIVITEPSLRAPSRLVTETRGELRETALRHLEVLAADGAPLLQIDLAAVGEVDIGGIGILVLLQKKAREHGMATRLVNVPLAVRRLLDLTQLDYLFELSGE